MMCMAVINRARTTETGQEMGSIVCMPCEDGNWNGNLPGYCNHNDSLTKNKAYIGNGASSPPVMAAMVPSENVVTMAKAKAAAGELSTAGNCRAVNMEPEIRAANTRRSVCSRCCNAKQCELTCLHKLPKKWESMWEWSGALTWL